MQSLQQNIVPSESPQQTLFSYNSASSIAPIMGKKVALDFEGGNITSDAGVLLLRETESQLGIISMLTKCINDTRRSSSIMHSVNELTTQRVFQIACGYEDGNDSNSLRIDPALKMALGRLPESGLDLASQPTFSRLENMITCRDLYRMAEGFVDHFLASYAEPPEVIVLDFDDTANVVHGHQQLALFNGYYQETCYQPTHVYEGFSGKLIATILRPGKRPGGNMGYSRAVKVSILRRVIPPNNESIATVSEEMGLNDQTIRNWVKSASECQLLSEETSPRFINAQEKYLLLKEAASISEADKGTFLRERGLHSEHLTLWNQQHGDARIVGNKRSWSLLSISKKPIPPALFAVPAGYQKIDSNEKPLGNQQKQQLKNLMEKMKQFE